MKIGFQDLIWGFPLWTLGLISGLPIVAEARFGSKYFLIPVLGLRDDVD